MSNPLEMPQSGDSNLAAQLEAHFEAQVAGALNLLKDNKEEVLFQGVYLEGKTPIAKQISREYMGDFSGTAEGLFLQRLADDAEKLGYSATVSLRSRNAEENFVLLVPTK